MDEFLLELDEDVEGMQSTIYLLQQQLKEAKEQIAGLQSENEQLRTGGNSQSSLNYDSNGSAITSDTYMGEEERERTRQEVEQTLSPKHEYRTSRQSNNSPYEVVNNHNKRDHLHGSNQDALQTSRSKNGGHDHPMETDRNDGIQTSFDDVKHTQEEQHATHRQLKLSQFAETKHSSNNSPGSTEVNNHHSHVIVSSKNANSDGACVLGENTDATSSEGWSPHGRKPSDDVDMEDDTSSQASDILTRTELKARTVGGLGDANEGENSLLQNGLVDTVMYDSQGDEEEI